MYLQAAINIYLQVVLTFVYVVIYKLVHVVICLQVVTRCHLFTSFTSWYTLSFVYKLLHVVICLQVHVVICLQVHVVICLQVVTRVYNVLQVHVSPRSEVTLGNDVALRKTLRKNWVEKVVIYYLYSSNESLLKTEIKFTISI